MSLCSRRVRTRVDFLRFGPSTLTEMNEEHLRRRIAEIGAERNLTAVSVAIHDYQTGRSFEMDGGQWFHAASVIKLAVLLGVFKAVEDGMLRLDDPVHVRNRFRSVV